MATSLLIIYPSRALLALTFAVLAPACALAGQTGSLKPQAAPASAAAAALSPDGAAPAPPAGVSDLKFREFFHMPIGPRGLAASDKLLALAGKRVRIVGYMAKQATPTSDFFILAPLPVALADEDDSLSDDLPASSVFVHLESGATPTRAVPYYAGLLRLTGTLSLGPREEADGHVSTVRMQLDPELVQALASRH